MRWCSDGVAMKRWRCDEETCFKPNSVNSVCKDCL